MLPDEFTLRLSHLGCADCFFGSRPTTFRVNTLKAHSLDLPFDVDVVPWHDNTFILRSGDLRSLTETGDYNNGKLYVQSLSSMLPPLILESKPGERIIDIAAAPGSKTTQIAAMMENRGTIVANDTSHVRRYRLVANLNMQGVTIATIEKEDGRSLWKKYPEHFDRALVDVPCSMEGRFNEQDPKTYQDWSLKKVKNLSHLQRWLLRSAISATKPGGIIVYSTCTLSPEENEEVIDWILAKEKGNIILEPVSLPHFHFDPPVLHWGTKNYDPSVRHTARVYPSELMEGFFIAKIRKVKSTV